MMSTIINGEGKEFKEMLESLKETLDSSMVGDSSPDSQEFISTYFPMIVRGLMGKKYQSFGYYYVQVNWLICYWLATRIERLNLANESELATLDEIFNDSAEFYSMSSESDTIWADLEQGIKDYHIEYKNEESYVTKLSSTFEYNVNCFGRLGGIDMLCKVPVVISANPEALPSLTTVAHILQRMAKIMTKVAVEKYCGNYLKECVNFIRLSYEKDLEKIHVPQLTAFLKEARALCAHFGKDNYQSSLLIELTIELGIKILSAPLIKDKTKGVILLINAFDSLETPYPTSGVKGGGDGKEFAEALSKFGFLELLLKADMKESLCYKASQILELLFCWGALSSEQVLGLWDLTLNNKAKEDVYFTLAEVAIHSGYTTASKLFELAKRLGPKDLTPGLISLFGSLAENEYYRNRGSNDANAVAVILSLKADANANRAPYILEEDIIRDSTELDIKGHIWGLIRSEDKIEDTEARGKLIKIFCELMVRMDKAEHKKYIDECMRAIAAEASAVQAMRIVLKMTDFIPHEEFYEPSEEFSKKIVCNLLKFKRAAAELNVQNRVVLDHGSAKPVVNVKDNSVNKDYYEDLVTSKQLNLTYYAELRERLDFLAVFFTKFKRPMTIETPPLLCRIFLTTSFSSQERDLFFAFLFNILHTTQGYELTRGGVFDSVFFEYLLRLEPESITEHALDCIFELIVGLNIKHNRIQILNQTSLKVLGSELIGAEALWDIYLHSGNDSKQSKATFYLRSFYASAATDEEDPFARELIGRSLELIKIGKDNPSKAQGEVQILRALDHLIRIARDKESVLSEYKKGEMVEILTLDGERDIRKHEVSLDMKAKELFEFMARRYEINAKMAQLEFMVDSMLVMDWEQTLREVHVHKNSKVSVRVKKEELEAPSKMEQDAAKDEGGLHLISEIVPGESPEFYKAALEEANSNTDVAVNNLLNEEYKAGLKKRQSEKESAKPKKGSSLLWSESAYQTLISLMDMHSDSILFKAWELLCMPEIKQRRYNDILNLKTRCDEVDWEAIFPGKSPYMVVFALEAVKEIMKQETALDWMQFFIEYQGFATLCRLVEGIYNGSLFPLLEGNLFQSKITAQGIQLSMIIVVNCIGAVLGSASCKQYEEYVKQAKKIVGDEILVCGNKKLANVPTEAVLSDMKNCISVAMIGIAHLLDYLKRRKLPQEAADGEEQFGTIIPAAFTLFSHLLILSSEPLSGVELGSVLKYVFFETNNELNKEIVANEIMAVNYALKETKKLEAHKDYFVKNLLICLPSPTDDCRNPKEYFNLVENIIEMYANAELSPAIVEEFAQTLAERINLRYNQPQLFLSYDETLSGYFQVLAALLKLPSTFPAISCKELVECICAELFGANESCSKSRRCNPACSLKNLLPIFFYSFSKCPEAMKLMVSPMSKFHEELLQYNPISIPTPSPGKANYVGLINCGATCYLNSLLQQLYMMPQVRNKILAIDCTKFEGIPCEKIVSNLNYIFTVLQKREHTCYSPKDFCLGFKWYTGRPISLCVQQDADEFYALLADKIESELKLINEASILKEILGISVIDEKVSLEDDHKMKSETEEQCLSLHVGVKGKGSLLKALDSFFQIEILDGENKYFCEELKKEIKAAKRLMIKKLGQTVIITLKRFEYNHREMKRKKLDDYCEFPETINFFKYTKEGIAGTLGRSESECEFEYSLAGVLIHSGTADRGHYYSFIRERDEGSANYGKWFEFNDENVAPLDPILLREKAFGSRQSRSFNCQYDHSVNAYMLVYEQSKTAARKMLPQTPKENLHDNDKANSLIYLSEKYGEFIHTCNNAILSYRPRERHSVLLRASIEMGPGHFQ